MKYLIISSYSKSLINFRGHLIEHLISNGNEVIAAGPDYDENTIKRLNDLGVKFEQIYLDRTGINIVNDLKCFFSIRRCIKKYKPDVVISYTIKPVIYGNLAAKSLKINKIFSMITGLGSAFNNGANLKSRLLSVITKILYSISLRNINGVIFQNNDDRNVFIDKKILQKSITFKVNGSGVDLEYFGKSEPIIQPIRFLFIGRIIQDKGIKEFIEASILVNKRFPSVEFHIVGWADNNPSGITEEKIEHWGKMDFIYFHGKQDDVRSFISMASVFVLPSYREGTPRTALEAMSMCKPLIMTDAPGCRETVKNERNGFLVPVKDSDKLANAMIKFIEKPYLIKEKGLESRKVAEQFFDVNIINKDLYKIFNS